MGTYNILPRRDFTNFVLWDLQFPNGNWNKLEPFPNLSNPRCFEYLINLNGYVGRTQSTSFMIPIDNNKLYKALKVLQC